MTKRYTWKEEEIEILMKNYEEKGPKYCSEQLDRNERSCKLKAKKLNIKFNRSFRYNFDNLSKIVQTSNSKSECIEKLGLKKFSGNFDTFNRYIKKYDLDISHFDTKYKKMNDYVQTFIKMDINEILVENSTYASRTSLKKRLYNEGLKKRICEKCGQGEEWNGEHISLILDHINGINNDNRLKNLRILCPNCNATLETHGGKNRNREKLGIKQ